ncbi:Cysteine/Histidine-rich C1 domain family protein [Abeliophyllum distichum]|uniref:Cysteine/Histidine-rich C1 domain family protein n=1 Tax=Abeliophyllum distichum TaxID=126358 RepID=A0ABD1RUM8_9LAMI
MKFQENQHFSHKHILNALKLDIGEEIDCNACENPITDPLHGCNSCHYYLHDECLNTPRSLQHICHPSHPLTLLPNPTYSSRSFSCNGCGSEGNAFSFSCAHCEFDLHIYCAKLPVKIFIDKHPHELKLLFNSPCKDENVVFVCDVCHGTVNRDNWVYYCSHCDFGTHSNCTTGYVTRKEEGNSSQSGNEYLMESTARKVEQIEAYNKAQEKLMAATLKAQIQAEGSRAVLDLVDSGSHRKYYYY